MALTASISTASWMSSDLCFSSRSSFISEILALRTHVAADFVDEIDCACDVRVEHIACVLEILIEERLAKPSTGIGEKRIDAPPVDLFVEFVDPFQGREIGLHRLHVPP